jgi:hypothetical protein
MTPPREITDKAKDRLHALTRDPSVQEGFLVADRRVDRILNATEYFRFAGKSILLVAGSCLVVIWRFHSVAVGAILFSTYMIVSVLTHGFRLVIRIHRQLILLARRHDVLSRRLGYDSVGDLDPGMKDILLNYCPYDTTFWETGGSCDCKNAFYSYFETSLRDAGISEEEIGQELGRYRDTVDPQNHKTNLKGPLPYTSADL